MKVLVGLFDWKSISSTFRSAKRDTPQRFISRPSQAFLEVPANELQLISISLKSKEGYSLSTHLDTSAVPSATVDSSSVRVIFFINSGAKQSFICALGLVSTERFCSSMDVATPRC